MASAANPSPATASVASVAGLAVNTAMPPYNVLPGVTGNPEVGIQQAIDDVAAAGGGEVFVPGTASASTYTVGLHVIPGQTAVAAALWLRPGVKFRPAPGVEFLLAAAATVPVGCSQVHGISNINPYGATQNEGMIREDVIFDGNCANQTSAILSTSNTMIGLFWGNAKNAWNWRCKVKGIYGTASGPPGESFHFMHNGCLSGGNIACEADGQALTTATGFSFNDSTGGTNAACRAHHMTNGHGFVSWQSAKCAWVACNAWKCVNQAGFNLENSSELSMTNCTSGGKSELRFDGDSQSPFFTAGQTTLGNAIGIWIRGCVGVTLAACTSTYNVENLIVGINTAVFTVATTITAGGTSGTNTATVQSSVGIPAIPTQGSYAGTPVSMAGYQATLTGGTPETLYIQSVSGNTITFSTNIANAGHTTVSWQTLPRVNDGITSVGCDFRFSTGLGGLGAGDVVVGAGGGDINFGEQAALPIVAGGTSGTNTAGLSGFPASASLGGGAIVTATGAGNTTEAISSGATIGSSAITLAAIPASTLISRVASVFPSTITFSGGANPAESFPVQSIAGSVVTISGTIANSGHTTATWATAELLTVSSTTPATSTITFTTNIVNSGYTQLLLTLSHYGVRIEGTYNNISEDDTEAAGAQQRTITAPSPVDWYNTGASGLREVVQGSTGSPASWLKRLSSATLGQIWGGNSVGQMVTTGRARARLAVADANATIAATNDIIAWTSISAARLGNLPAIANVATGSEYLLCDESGSCSLANTITATPNGADTIAGDSVIQSARGTLRVVSTGAAWIGFATPKIGAHRIYSGNTLITAGQTATTSGLNLTSLGSLGGAAASQSVFRLNPSNVPPWAILRLTLEYETNNTAPGVNFTIGLYPLSSPAGAAGTAVTYTAGAATGTVVINAPAANTADKVTTTFAFPAEGIFALQAIVSGTTAANSAIHVRGTLEAIY